MSTTVVRGNGYKLTPNTGLFVLTRGRLRGGGGERVQDGVPDGVHHQAGASPSGGGRGGVPHCPAGGVRGRGGRSPDSAGV